MYTSLPPAVCVCVYVYVSDGVLRCRPQPEVVKFEEDAKTAAAVSPDVARDALLRYIDESECCWGTKPAKECDIATNFWASIVCRMETFVEHRTTAYEQVL